MKSKGDSEASLSLAAPELYSLIDPGRKALTIGELEDLAVNSRVAGLSDSCLVGGVCLCFSCADWSISGNLNLTDLV
jgi:hypothetical protein